MIGHLIDGRRVEGRSSFEAPVAGGGRSYARATAADFQRALAALEHGRPPAESLLAEAAHLVEDDLAWVDDVAAALGIPAEDLPERIAKVVPVPPGSGHRGSPTTMLLAAHWTDGVGELGRRLLGALASGAAVLLLSDRRLPEAADVWADALLDAGLPPGRLSLLHGAELGDLASRADAPDRARLTVDDERAAVELRAAVGERRWAFDWPQGRVRRAGSSGLETPRRAFESAFGARAALGGLLPGRTTVLEVLEAEHAGWVDALVPLVDAALRAASGGARREPVPSPDAALRRTFADAVSRLVEQGATPVALAEHRGQPVFAPSLFVNGESWMEPVKQLPCVPVLVVRRVSDEPA
ncbi:hypothetical protein [Rohdeia mirabilis]|uniref:hypothetical protein n=1 Tax=Rohdeia mirabilis TaxID=2528008 RepID=UPI003AF3A819